MPTEVSVEPSLRNRGQILWDAYEDEGLVYITVLALGPEGQVTTPFHMEFMEKNADITYPVLRDTESLLRRKGAYPCPMDILIGPDMEVMEMGRLPITEAWVESKLGQVF